MEIKGREIIAADGKYIHRNGTDSYFKRCILLKDETETNFEEVDTIPEVIEEDTALKTVTEEKVKAMFFARSMPTMINTFGLTNKEALSVKDMFPVWEIEKEVKKGERYQSDNLLWECIKDHTTQENWKPSIQTASLWKVVEIEHGGNISDPIPYTPPMEIFKDKYYTQNSIKYKCIRDSEIPLSHDLNALVGTYVELVK